jgi:hypothetical protein
LLLNHLIDKTQDLVKTDLQSTAKMKKIKIIIGQKTATAILYDNASSRDFAAMLPLEMHLEDYNSKEKISNLPKKLSITDAPQGFDPSIDDLTYYAPWGNLALFYKDFSYSPGLVSLGKITSGIELFSKSGTLDVKIELDK